MASSFDIHGFRFVLSGDVPGALAALALRWFLLTGFALQLALEAAKWLVGHKRPLRAARVRAYWQVVCSGLKGESGSL